jgi:hypothetical protein
MATKLYDLARMSTATTGTGTMTLGSAVSGFLSFAGAGVQDGETVWYAIRDGASSEVGTGVYTSVGTTLSRTVIKSTNADNAISLSGSAEVFITSIAESFGIGTETQPGLFEKATDAEVRASTADKAITADRVESASALVALTDAAPVAVNWDSGINFSLTVTAARQIDNPTNGQPGTYRTILVQGDNTTDRTITFDTEFLGDVPTITDCDSTKWYLLTIRCITTTHFVVTSVVAKKP